MYTPKTQKENLIIEQIKHLEELDNVGYYGYIYINYLIDIIAEVAFGCVHDHAGHVIYPEDDLELMKKISAVISNMVNKEVIKVSKSKKMFKLCQKG